MSKNVVVIGGGLSSKHCVELLVKDKNVKVTMIQANRFVEWPLAMTCVIVKPELHDKALAPNCATFQVPGADYKYGVAKEVDALKKQVVLQTNEVVPFDALVVATGIKMPLIYPGLGVSLEERKAEIKKVGDSIRDASSVVVAGGGPVGLELVGDIRAEYPSKRVVLLTRGKVLSQWPDGKRAKVETQLKAMNIEVVSMAVDAPKEYLLEKGVIGDLNYDVYIPAFSQGPNTDFFQGCSGLLDGKGCVTTNNFLQSGQHNSIFAIGYPHGKEPFVGMPKLEAQWTSVAHNVKALLAGKPLKEHKEGMPFMRLPPAILIGHGPKGYGYLDFDNVPPPAKCCCCCGLGGFPFCPPLICWPCCGPCACGYCCGPSEGTGFAKLMGGMAFKSGGFHIKGFGEAPQQQAMS